MNDMKYLSYAQRRPQKQGFTPTSEERSECAHSFRPSAVGANTRSGFTLVETLVAISILLVAIMGPMTIAARGLQSAFYAREQITAFSLAQEGVELIRAIRDQNALEGESWLADISAVCVGSGAWCGLDARGSTVRSCGSDSCQLNDAGAMLGSRGFYTYAGSTLSQFTRRIRVNPLSGGREAEITVEVSWQSGLFAGEKKVTIQSSIFNQYDDI